MESNRIRPRSVWLRVVSIIGGSNISLGSVIPLVPRPSGEMVELKIPSFPDVVVGENSLLVSSAPDASISFSGDQSVSAPHAIIELGEFIFIMDLKSRRGTRIGNAALRPNTFYQAFVGDEIKFGDVRCRIESNQLDLRDFSGERDLRSASPTLPITGQSVDETGSLILGTEDSGIDDAPTMPIFSSPPLTAIPAKLEMMSDEERTLESEMTLPPVVGFESAPKMTLSSQEVAVLVNRVVSASKSGREDDESSLSSIVPRPPPIPSIDSDLLDASNSRGEDGEDGSSVWKKVQGKNNELPPFLKRLQVGNDEQNVYVDERTASSVLSPGYVLDDIDGSFPSGDVIERSSRGRSKRKIRSKTSSQGSHLSKRVRAIQPSILFTGYLDRAGQRAVKRLGADISMNPLSCTHVVTDRLRRTIKFLSALSHSPYVVGPSWIVACRSAGALVDEEPHFLVDPEGEKQFCVCLQQSLVRAKKGPLFVGMSFHFGGETCPPRHELASVVKSAGGEVLLRSPREPAEHIMMITSNEELTAQWKKAGFVVKTEEFVLASVLRQEIVET